MKHFRKRLNITYPFQRITFARNPKPIAYSL
jgi:hypothetical protein